MSSELGLILIGALMLVIAATGFYFAIRGCPFPKAKAKDKEASMTVELASPPPAVAAIRQPIKARMEISPEVYQILASNLKSALTDLHALQGGIPCWLSAPASLATRLEGHLTQMQGAIGCIDIVREDVGLDAADPA